MIRWLRDLKARRASQYLAMVRVRKERELVRSTAQQLRKDMGLPPDRRLAS